MSWLFASDSKRIRASASSSVLPMNIQGLFSLGLTGLISLLSKGLSRVFSSTAFRNQWFFGTRSSLWSSSHICTWLLENHMFDYMAWLQSTSAVTLEAKKRKSVTVSTFSHLFAMKWWDQMSWSQFIECWALSQLFLSLLSPSSRGFLCPLHFLPLVKYYLHIWVFWDFFVFCFYFSKQSWFQLVIHPAQHFALCTLYRS